MACKFRGRRSIFCIWVCVCVAGAAFGSCLKGLDVFERAARGLNLRDRRSTLEMAHGFRGRRSIFCIWVCVCVAGAAFGCCLKGLDVFERAARGLNLRDRRSTLEMAHRFRGRRSIFCIWVSKGTGCCRARGSGAQSAWQAQYFVHLGVCLRGGAAFGSCLRDWMLSSTRLGGSICVTGAALWRWLANFVSRAVFSAFGCVFAWQGQHLVAV